VFISCGQQKGTEEVQIASKIADGLDKMGFEPYVAVSEQSLKGVKENIFQRLRTSEYLIFVDFQRERLGRPRKRYELGAFHDTGKHRGSLFSNQELAIATFLDTESLCFQEDGVKEGDGVLRFIQANSIRFGDRHSLPDLVLEKVKDRKWRPDWRNEITLQRDPNEYEDVSDAHTGLLTRFYHIEARNRHLSETAFECVAYIERIVDLSTDSDRHIELVEVKWKGVTVDRVAIAPQRFRYLDGCFVSHNRPNVATLGINRMIIDYSGFINAYTLIGPGDFRLTYVIFSNKFAPARANFKLHIGTTLGDVKFL
jgi:hypothetical protein